ncbi:Endoglucanase 7, partial [Ananas comosus]
LDYAGALSKSLLYFEAQRSGHLPYNQRARVARPLGPHRRPRARRMSIWSAGITTRATTQVRLPMAFTVTMLAWSVLEHGEHVAAPASSSTPRGHQVGDRLLHQGPHRAQCPLGSGDGGTDHYCWQRPEDMTTSRQAYKIDAEHPGSELAGETAAAMAAASIVFRPSDPHYADLLLRHAEQLLEFGDRYRGKYDASVRAVKGYYPSVSGYYDELLWAALWLHRATGRAEYLDYAVANADGFGGTGWAVTEFSWDIKYAGVQVLASKLLMEGEFEVDEKQEKILKQYKSKAEHYLCSCLNKNTAGSNVRRTPGGLLFVRQWNNMQYVSGAAFLATAFSNYLSKSSNQELTCPTGSLGAQELLSFAKSQADYILGSNPTGLSYLVGFGSKHPRRVHHRAASILPYKKDKAFIGCAQGYDAWFGRGKENPNMLVGAIVGGPNAKDEFRDARGNYMQTEACTYNTAPMVGVFARLTQLQGQHTQGFKPPQSISSYK